VARRRRRLTPIVAVSGYSGAGKTRLVARLVQALARRDLRVSVLKHTGHDHPFDVPGKDTFVAREAGAVSAAIAGPAGVAYFGPPVKGIRALAALGPPVDLILAEGWKREPLPRVEVHRRSVNPAFLCAEDERVFAVVTDEPPPRPLPCFDADDAEGLAALICARLGIGPRTGRGRLPGGPAMSRLATSERPSAPRGASMAKTSSRKSGTSRGTSARSRKSTTGRSKGSTAARRKTASKASRSAAGRKGGNATLRTRGPEFYSEIGRKGGKASGGTRARRGGSTTRKKTARRASKRRGAKK
jgi:molybdopterin-guanine dinucleotide biosynthesis protein B